MMMKYLAGPAWYAVVVAAFAAAILIVFISETHPAPGCLSLGQARASGHGYPRYKRVDGRRCWYVNGRQLQALRAPPKNRLRPSREDRAPQPGPPQPRQPREEPAGSLEAEAAPTGAADAQAAPAPFLRAPRWRFAQAFEVGSARAAGIEAADAGRATASRAVMLETRRPQPINRARKTVAIILASVGVALAGTIFVLRLIDDRRRLRAIRRRTLMWRDDKRNIYR